MSDLVVSGEERFVRIFYDVERLAVPIYHDMVQAIISFTCGDKQACAIYVRGIADQLCFALDVYFRHLHDQSVARSIWLSHVQGFYGWGIGPYDEANNEWIKFNGLSGNQALLFQALDAFRGLPQYLSATDQERNVPIRQRIFCKALAKYSFRRSLGEQPIDEHEAQILQDFRDIVKRLKVSAAEYIMRSYS
jgi:hypothetical protein